MTVAVRFRALRSARTQGGGLRGRIKESAGSSAPRTAHDGRTQGTRQRERTLDGPTPGAVPYCSRTSFREQPSAPFACYLGSGHAMHVTRDGGLPLCRRHDSPCVLGRTDPRAPRRKTPGHAGGGSGGRTEQTPQRRRHPNVRHDSGERPTDLCPDRQPRLRSRVPVPERFLGSRQARGRGPRVTSRS